MMTEIMHGAVLMAAAQKQGVTIANDDALTILSYMGLEDQHLMVSDDLSFMVLRRYTSGRKFTNKLASVLDVVLAAIEVCEKLLDYTLKAEQDEDSIPAMLEFNSDQRKLHRVATCIELATAT